MAVHRESKVPKAKNCMPTTDAHLELRGPEARSCLLNHCTPRLPEG